jgi:hypothetical protein
MSDIVWIFLGLALAIAFASDRIVYAVVGRPGGGLKPWAITVARIVVGVLGAISGVVIGNQYIAGAGGLLGIEFGPPIFGWAFPAPKRGPEEASGGNNPSGGTEKEKDILRKVQMFLARAEVENLLKQEGEQVLSLLSDAAVGDSNAVTAFAIADEQLARREDYISRILTEWPLLEEADEAQENLIFRMKWRAAKTGNPRAVADFERAKAELREKGGHFDEASGKWGR